MQLTENKEHRKLNISKCCFLFYRAQAILLHLLNIKSNMLEIVSKRLLKKRAEKSLNERNIQLLTEKYTKNIFKF